MVKSKFPGKPSKHFHRRKVSPAINIEDFEGLKAAEDIYCRLSLFDFLFREEEEVSSFHGFSPHEYAKPKSMKKIKSDVKSKKKCFTVGNCSTSNSKSTKKESKDKNNLPSTTQNIEVCSNSDINGTENDANDENMEKLKKTNSGPVIPLTGKFVLPSRSAHSSRVIKPNKRFIQSESDDGVPYKKQRLKQDVDVIINNTDNNVPEESVSSENTSIDKFHSSDSNISDSSPNSASSSPVKFVLRKPRLKIKSQPFSKVEGPFSSPGNRNGLHGGSKYRSCPATKVVCGVCWTVRSYKFLMQARKFGIFACEPCRRFILKVLKTEREKLLQPLTCMSGTGNCPIRNSTFVSHQPFGTPPKKSQIEAPRRCQGCWLNLCLRSFKMPLELSKRLATYLPSEVLQKYPISSLISSYNELPNKSAEMKNTEVSVVKVIKKRKPTEETKKGKNRQKLLLAGPRVKHVCRSASLVLGQPAATFLGNSSKSELSNHSFDDDTFSTKSNSSNGEAMVETDIIRKQDYLSADKDNNLKDKNTAVEKPVARMLQDLGRANCELLDGIELHESEKKFAKISIDFWESYDPEEVLQSGFPLLGCNPFPIRAICFLCGSAGYEKLVHCSYCCEPYHTFCVSSTLHFATKDKNWWKLDWLCPKCIHCEICSKVGGVQLTCSKCSKSYHNNCVPPGRAHISDNSWVCPACLFCKSCNDTQVHVFIGNVPLCKNCFKQRKKGNFCPLCQRCYDENDYSTKMMECSDCKSWIHAHCEGLSDEKYQVLSNLPSTIEFVCRNCCKDPPALWSVAVNAELRAGYLNVIRALSKNRSICSYLKTSPKKIVCACQDANRKPIHLKSLSGQSDITLLNNKNIHSGSPLTITDEKNTDLGLLTPKLTKDDEESLQTVKSGFLNLVSNKENDNEKELTIYSLTNEIETKNNTYNRNSSQLLSIACNNTEINSDCRIKKYFTQNELNEINSGSELSDISEKTCSCKGDNTNVSSQPFSLMVIKSKAMNDDYSSILEFSRDMEKVIKEINRPDILKMYYKALRQIFPWFDPKDSENNESTIFGLESFSENKLRECRKSIEGGENESVQKIERNNSVEGLLSHDQNYYYIGLDLVDDRICMLCKLIGEGKPNQEGRLLYCGQNEWVHVNCALWSSEVFEEIDGSLQNVHSAISRARLIRCFGCDKKGASVGCCAKSCPSAYHFGCAINANCVFLENKEVFCKMHKNLSSVKDVHKEEDFSIARSVYVELDHKKKKDVLRNEVRLCLGSLSIINLGEIIPELSDMEDILLPCEFHCSRLYWSSKEPWKLVRYYIKTKVTHTYQEQILEGETNYTIDHSLEFTPPPSPVDEMFQINSTQYPVDEKDIKLVVNHIIDTICSKEDENNISEQATTDLLPPELKEAIFEDLPHDLLDGISMHDIFTKMNFDDILSEVKHESTTYGESSHVENVKKSFSEEQKRHELINKNKLLKTNTVKSNKNLVKSHNFFRDRKGNNSSSIKSEQFLSKVKDRSWKSCKLLQVDGAVDLSESDQSDDSCDMISNSTNNYTNITSMEDDPVKCSRCHRTYRSNVGYERHLSSCNYLSSSECESSEEERDKPVDCLMENNSCDVDTNMLDTTMQRNIQTSINQPESNGTILNQISSNITTMSVDTTSSICPVEQSVVCPVEQAAICSVEQTISSNSSISMNGGTQLPNTLNINMNHMNGELNPFKTNKLSLSAGEFNEEQVSLNSRPYENYINHTSEQQSIVEIENSIPSAPPPTIILQQMPTENVIPTYIPSYSQSSQQNIQYITSVDSQDKFITSSHLTPGTYHIQSAQTIQQPVVQNVPTVVGTIIQTNGVDQIVLNGANSSLDMYTQPQNNLYITNTPMIVGMETVVSNTVMSSSQFISASMPGMLAASSYSATTTQVFQATKPVIDIPQSYVVVNTNPPIIENNTSCVQPSIIQNNVVSQPTPWNNLIQCQDPYKLNKNVSYQTVTRQIIHEQKEIDGVKMINSTQETIVIEPIAATSSENNVEQIPKITAPVINEQPTFSQPPSSFRRVVQNVKHNGHAKTNHVKIVELPKSSSVCKEKPQQAVAPVVVKKVLENGLKNVNICKKPSVKPETAICDIPSKINPVETTLQTIESTPAPPVCNPEIKKSPEIKKVEVKFDDVIAKKDDIKPTNNIIKNTTKITDNISDNTPVLPKQTEVNSVKSSVNKPSAKTKRENPNIRKVIQEEPKITYEITSDDGFSYSTNNIKIAWEKVFEKVQKAREAKGLPPLTENPFSSPSTMLKKMMGLGNNSVKYVLEQLPGASGCSKYKPMYHQKKLSLLEQEMSKDLKGNISGCARTEVFKHTRHKYDMFSWLASRHRRPPKLLAPDNDCINGGRRTNMNLPMAMRFRHLKEASNAVGVFRSDIHGRGLFCLRDIDSGEMVIEYAGEVIRSALTDKRERYYTAKGIGCYMFRIDDKFVVDATMKGNAARFINHSCEPNCYSKVVDILGKKHILIFAMRRILQGEELTYDYKFPLEEEKINCHCLSRRCRKYLN